jgi:hypothetical protein
MSSILKVDAIQNTGGTSALTIDSSGRVLTPARPAFKVYIGSTGWVDIVHNATRRIPFNAETYDVGGCFNTSTSTFTAPISGYYFFYASVYTHNGAGVKVLEFYTGGNDPASGGSTMALTQDDGALGTMQLSTTHYFNAGEKMAAYFYQTNDVTTGVYSSNSPAYSHFLGYLIG